MPNRDGTGPNGEGPMTGRGLGSCNKDGKPVGRGRRPAPGRRGQGRGLGRKAN